MAFDDRTTQPANQNRPVSKPLDTAPKSDKPQDTSQSRPKYTDWASI